VGISESDVHALRGILERAIPKNRGAEFLDLIEDVASDVCHETNPECPRCELRKVCAYALTHKQDAHNLAHAAKTGAAKAAKEATKASKHNDTEASSPSAAKKNSAPKGPKAAPQPPPLPPPSKPPRDKHRGAK
jgi:adenine-specific DNA glycosylase